MRPLLLLALSLATLTAAEPAPAAAASSTVGDLVLVQPWSRASSKMAQAGAAFIAIDNPGTTADRLLAAESTAAERVELHTVITDGDGLKRMTPVQEIAIPAHGRTELKPGAFHLMLLGLRRPLTPGERIPLVLHFAQAGTATVAALVGGPADLTAAEAYGRAGSSTAAEPMDCCRP